MTDTHLCGQVLVAMPGMTDPRFSESVIYLVEHSDQSAMGLVINKEIPDMVMGDVFDDLDLGAPQDLIRLPEARRAQEVLQGGPVETGRGFVLHSRDYFRDGNSLAVTEDVAMTPTLDALKAMAFEAAPKDAVFALGYCGWGPGQLERELADNSWLVVPPSHDLLFATPLTERYETALQLLGITRASLHAEGGHA